jgi:class 3 adenylate cyclase
MLPFGGPYNVPASAAKPRLSVAAVNRCPELAAVVELKPQEVAERRQVTVIFSDLVASTAPSARMDPENIHRLAFSGSLAFMTE